MGELVSAFVFALAVLLSPKTCRPGWYVEGVRPSGLARCRPEPPRDCGEPVPPFEQPCPHDERVEQRVIICTGGTQPIVVDERTIGCQRRR